MRKSIFSPEQEVLLFELQKARREAGLTQTQLAERLQKTQAWVSQCETGERRIDTLELRAICRAIEIPFLDFLKRVEDALQKEGL
ncbi:MAG: helix-turn-helix domain-containing protein [Armatimonadota bacterium]